MAQQTVSEHRSVEIPRISTSHDLLDNPIWSALRTEHAGLALGDEQARRYPPAIGPLSGIPNQSPQSYESLRSLTDPEGAVALFLLEEPQPTSGWTPIRTGRITQMVYNGETDTHAVSKSAATSGDAQIRRLTPSDAPAMVALAELAEPGPFRLRTMELGNFYGVFHSDQLVAMAGKRMHLPGFTEISAVCTHPDARGRGYASQLVSIVKDEIVRDGKTPFLHATVGNPAMRVYEKLGFAVRQTFHLIVLKNQVLKNQA